MVTQRSSVTQKRGEGTAACASANPPPLLLGMCSSVCARATVCVSLIPQLECGCLVACPCVFCCQAAATRTVCISLCITHLDAKINHLHEEASPPHPPSPPVGTVLPGETPVTPCSDSHFTSEPVPWARGLLGTHTTQILLWGPKPCSGSSNPIIAELTVIANIRDTLTWSQRMKTPTVSQEESGGWDRCRGK